MLLRELVDVSRQVAATRSRKEKTQLIGALLLRAEPGERALVAHYLGGRLRQRRTGLGWRGLQALPSPSSESSLEVGEVDAAFEAMSLLAGPGSAGLRTAAVAELFGRATAEEQQWLRAVAVGEVRQGALEAIVTEALASAAGVPLTAVRRAAMLAGGATYVVDAAFEGPAALAEVGLTVGRPVLPMLASSAPDVAAAVAKAGSATVGVDAKLDGIRIQVHRDGDDVVVATRSLDDITHRLPEVVAVARSLPAHRVVLDGEALWLAADGRPRPFQETASRTSSSAGGDAESVVSPYFFDVLHLDGTDLIDQPAHERWQVLERLVPAAHRVRRWIGSDVAAATEFAATVLASGHEGVVVKSVDAPYDAGRRGSAWVKVKPVHTLDLVVLAVEHGSGRRRGLLSNIHLGARDASSPTGFVMLGKTLEETGYEPGWVMVGKTFKGMSDEMLAWQTERFRELQVSDDGRVVRVRPEQVVEIAFDGVQRSSRYAGGVALRFARVVRYRDDKTAGEADTIATVRSYL
ncbi:ATP-dependent DNA ligase [Nocardioides nitrophenolicus]|uniref:ATP-dependent DNA ligase n=1 Tax=Nocardioides nitrophenolicus TaxID=60489 RepID=UPI001958DD28|nr:ATP-dependent DNA ligase [Nocardioides nitrophenolicus]MBM7515186.1 DNA ligase-1 [Nocardioides nitrophenolicus]